MPLECDVGSAHGLEEDCMTAAPPPRPSKSSLLHRADEGETTFAYCGTSCVRMHRRGFVRTKKNPTFYTRFRSAEECDKDSTRHRPNERRTRAIRSESPFYKWNS